MMQRRIVRRVGSAIAALAVTSLAFVGLTANGSEAATTTRFEMVRSAAAVNSGCLPDAQAHVRVEQRQDNERMKVFVSGLPANTEFDLFITQLPDAPFGVAWYQSDLHTNKHGNGDVTVQGRFNHETF